MKCDIPHEGYEITIMLRIIAGVTLDIENTIKEGDYYRAIEMCQSFRKAIKEDLKTIGDNR
jgi:hypothetical protein